MASWDLKEIGWEVLDLFVSSGSKLTVRVIDETQNKVSHLYAALTVMISSLLVSRTTSFTISLATIVLIVAMDMYREKRDRVVVTITPIPKTVRPKSPTKPAPKVAVKGDVPKVPAKGTAPEVAPKRRNSVADRPPTPVYPRPILKSDSKKSSKENGLRFAF